MTWVKFDDQFNQHPKINKAGPLPTLLHVKAIIWSCQYGTDGHIPHETVGQLINWAEAKIFICHDLPSVFDGDVRGKANLPCSYEMANHLCHCGLWTENETEGWDIHDFLEYQLPAKERKTRQKTISDARRKAGRAGAKKRWQKDGKSLAKNSPVPVPVPVPDPVRMNESDSGKNGKLNISEVEARCYPRFGAMSGRNIPKISRLCPIADWELDAALKTQGKTWGYFAKVVESCREEQARPPVPPAMDKPKTKEERDFEEFMRRTDPERNHG